MNEKPKYQGGGIFWPVILIGLGIVLLLQQSGYLNWSLLDIAVRLWPVLIIAIGADILIGRRSFLGSILALLLVLLLLGGGLLLIGVGPVAGNPLSGEVIKQPLPDAKSASITLSPDAGRLQIRPLAESSANLIEADIRQTSPGSVVSGSDLLDGSSRFYIDSRGPETYFYRPSDRIVWDVLLNPKPSLELDLMLGAGEIDADLTTLNVETVDIKIGAGHLQLSLPESGTVKVTIAIGAGGADIKIPSGVAVDIDCHTGVGDCELPNGSGFWSQSYISEEYNSAKNKIQLEIQVGFGKATVQ